MPINQTTTIGDKPGWVLKYLVDHEQARPLDVLADFCREFTPDEMHDELNALKENAIVHDFYNDPGDRDHLIYLINWLRRTLEACYLLTEKK
jgi:hypothetical protein